VPLTSDTITFENITNMLDPVNNLDILGIDNKILKQEFEIDSDNGLCFENITPDKLGNIFIDGDKVYFRNIQKNYENGSTYYTISNYYTSKEYVAGESIISSVQPIEVSTSEYTMDENSTYIKFNDAPTIGEIITVIAEN
jgi:CTP:phosphocholine cytidylyltransferase-like protein